MAQNRSNADYGAVYVDQEAVRNPRTQMAADKFNRLAEDVAQMTRTSTKVEVVFTTTSTAAPTSVTPTSGPTQWGTGSAYHPAISKTATGTYVLTWDSSYDDGLVGTDADAVSETETLALTRAQGVVMSATQFGHVYCVASANVVTAYVRDAAGTLTDLSGTASIWVEAK
jgi:hypothetical protein